MTPMFSILDEKTTSLFKIYETFHKFPSELVTKHILFGIFGKTPFLCKVSLFTHRPFFFASPNAPYFETWGRTPVSSDPRKFFLESI